MLGGEDLKDACKLRPGSPALRRRVRAWQALTALLPFLTPGRIRAAFELTWHCMGVRGLAAPSWRLPFQARAYNAVGSCAVTLLSVGQIHACRLLCMALHECAQPFLLTSEWTRFDSSISQKVTSLGALTV